MRHIFLLLLFTIVSMANTQPYEREITLPKVTKPTLVELKLDNTIYEHSSLNLHDIRLLSQEGTEGYFIRSHQNKIVENQKRLYPSLYNRDKAELTFKFKKLFDIERIVLHIEDRDFESLFDVYGDGKLLVKNYQLFDYSSETGTQNFTIKIPKSSVKNLVIHYHLDKTTSFYKKYQKIQKARQYLTIKSALFSNSNKNKEPLEEESEIKLLKVETKEKESRYTFATKQIPFSKLEPMIEEKNFNRDATIYLSNKKKEWKFLSHFNITASLLNHKNNKVAYSSGKAKYLQIRIDNQDNNPLTIKAIKLFTKPKYLCFITNPNSYYKVQYGDISLNTPHYEVANLVDYNTPFIIGKFQEERELKVENHIKKISFLEQHKQLLITLFLLLAVGILGYIAFGLLKRTELDV